MLNLLLNFRRVAIVIVALGGLLLSTSAKATTLTIAIPNNDDMIALKKLSSRWEEETGNKINWIVLEENVLRQRVTTDIATNSGLFDIVTIGSYEAPLWGKAGWLKALDDFQTTYDYADIFPSVRKALSVDGKLYAAPFHAESSFTFYRSDLFKKAGLTMPNHPTWTQIRKFADLLTDKRREQYGICLRGKPGWGENTALFTTIVNTFGGRWFDLHWYPQLTSPEWQSALKFYIDLLNVDGPPGASSDGYNENRALFATGHCGIWVDSTAAAGSIFNKATSDVMNVTAFAQAPIMNVPNGAGWFWSWALAVPVTSKHIEAAKSFVEWATSARYVKLVGETLGWTVAPAGTRASTYATPAYLKAAPFAKMANEAMLAVDPTHPTAQPVPYVGVQYVTIPEYQDIGTRVGQIIAAALVGQLSVGEALKQAQAITLSAMQQGGYVQ